MGSAFLFWVLASPPCDWVLKCLRTPRVDAGWQGPFVYYLAHRRRGDGELLTRRIGSARGGVCLMLLSLMQQQAENSWTFTLLFSCLLLCPGCYWNKLVKKKLGYWRLCALPVGLVWLLLSLAFSCSCGGWFDARGFCLFAVVLWPDTIMCCVLLGSGWLHTAANDSICSTAGRVAENGRTKLMPAGVVLLPFCMYFWSAASVRTLLCIWAVDSLDWSCREWHSTASSTIAVSSTHGPMQCTCQANTEGNMRCTCTGLDCLSFLPLPLVGPVRPGRDESETTRMDAWSTGTGKTSGHVYVRVRTRALRWGRGSILSLSEGQPHSASLFVPARNRSPMPGRHHTTAGGAQRQLCADCTHARSTQLLVSLVSFLRFPFLFQA
jgi:hypothetical protein